MRLAILGVGLIGGSIGRAARERGLAEVTGYVRNPAKRDECLEVGAVDDLTQLGEAHRSGRPLHDAEGHVARPARAAARPCSMPARRP